MASGNIPFDEVLREVLRDNSDGNFASESEQELSDHEETTGSEPEPESERNSRSSEENKSEISG